jgi:hypothetical protein
VTIATTATIAARRRVRGALLGAALGAGLALAATESIAQDGGNPRLGGPRATSTLLPADLEARLQEAVAAYEAERPAEAEQLFRRLVEDGAAHPAVLVGLGNSAYRLGRWVEAVYAYEWAALLDPGAPDVAENLRLARAHLVADTLPTDESPAARALREQLRRVPARLTLLVFALAWTAGWSVLALRQAGRLAGWTWAGVALLVLAVPLAAHVAFRLHETRGPPRGVLQDVSTEVRSGPGEDYASLFTLHAGTLVEAREQRAGWRRIAIPQGPEGWAPSSAIAIIGDPSTLR